MSEIAGGFAIGIGSGLAIGIGSGRAAGIADGEKRALARVEQNIRELAQTSNLKIYADDKELTLEEFTAAVIAREST